MNRTTVVILALLASILLSSGVVFANHGVVDQENIVITESGVLIQRQKPVGQEFSPSLPVLTGVDVQVARFFIPGSSVITANIRKGTINSPILASASQSVSVLIPDRVGVLLHFDFLPGLRVTPGDGYVLELESSTRYTFWKNGYDTYPRGSAIIRGERRLNVDYVFRSFGLDFVGVTIDIKPGSNPSCFNNNGHGVIPVAILGTGDFDVYEIDAGTVQLEGLAVAAKGKARKLLAAFEDVNGDGFTDLVVKIGDVDGTFTRGSSEAKLTGVLLDGTPIEGSGEICITQ